MGPRVRMAFAAPRIYFVHVERKREKKEGGEKKRKADSESTVSLTHSHIPTRNEGRKEGREKEENAWRGNKKREKRKSYSVKARFSNHLSPSSEEEKGEGGKGGERGERGTTRKSGLMPASSNFRSLHPY